MITFLAFILLEILKFIIPTPTL